MDAVFELINVTPHAVTVYDDTDTPVASWPPSGSFTRLVESCAEGQPLMTDQGVVPLARVVYTGEIEGLPEPRAATAYIVSRVTAAAVDRPDLYFPFDEVRDERGQILGCRALGQFVHGATSESEGEGAE